MTFVRTCHVRDMKRPPPTWAFCLVRGALVEPPVGIEPTTFSVVVADDTGSWHAGVSHGLGTMLTADVVRGATT